MKMKVVDIKKAKGYKNLKVKGKAKLKKKELCALLQKQTGIDYSLKTKAELLIIIKEQKNC
jgi:hypothetical protein